MPTLSRRTLIKTLTVAGAAALTDVSAAQNASEIEGLTLKGNIRQSVSKWKRKSLVYLLGNAGTWTHRKAHRHRDRFFQYVRTMPVTKAAQYLFSNTYEIGVAGLPCNRNYGTGLTYYALYRTLLDLGKVPLMIELPRNSYVYRLCYRRDDGQSGFKNFPYEKGGIAETFQEKNQFKKRINAATQ